MMGKNEDVRLPTNQASGVASELPVIRPNASNDMRAPEIQP